METTVITMIVLTLCVLLATVFIPLIRIELQNNKAQKHYENSVRKLDRERYGNSPTTTQILDRLNDNKGGIDDRLKNIAYAIKHM